MKSVQAAKARSGSYAHLPSSPPKSQLTGATICDDVSSRGLQNPKSSKASGDTNAKEDICIPAIYDKVVTLDLNLSIQTNKQTNCFTDLAKSGDFLKGIWQNFDFVNPATLIVRHHFLYTKC